MARPPRPVACLDVPIRGGLKEPKISTFATIILDLKRFDHNFLRQPASQLQCSAGGTLILFRLASYCLIHPLTGLMSIPRRFYTSCRYIDKMELCMTVRMSSWRVPACVRACVLMILTRIESKWHRPHCSASCIGTGTRVRAHTLSFPQAACDAFIIFANVPNKASNSAPIIQT